MITGQNGFEESLEYQQNVPIPSRHELKPNEVLVRLHAASLNYRELMITTSGVGFPDTKRQKLSNR